MLCTGGRGGVAGSSHRMEASGQLWVDPSSPSVLLFPMLFVWLVLRAGVGGTENSVCVPGVAPLGITLWVGGPVADGGQCHIKPAETGGGGGTLPLVDRNKTDRI